MPVYHCHYGDCANLAFEECGGSSEVFTATDSRGRTWLCAETDLAKIPGDGLPEGVLDSIEAQMALHRRGHSEVGSTVMHIDAPDRVAARWKLVRATYPTADESKLRLALANVHPAAENFSCGPCVPYTLSLGGAFGFLTFHGCNEREAWHHAAERLCGPAFAGEQNAMATLTFDPVSIPLYRDGDGVIRVIGTRIVLDTVLALHLAGESPEAIAEGYPRVPLADVYAMIGFYHRNKVELDEYLSARKGEADRLRLEIEARQGSSSNEFSSEVKERWARRGQAHAAFDR